MVEYGEREEDEALGDEVELDVMNSPEQDDGDEPDGHLQSEECAPR